MESASESVTVRESGDTCRSGDISESGSVTVSDRAEVSVMSRVSELKEGNCMAEESLSESMHAVLSVARVESGRKKMLPPVAKGPDMPLMTEAPHGSIRMMTHAHNMSLNLFLSIGCKYRGFLFPSAHCTAYFPKFAVTMDSIRQLFERYSGTAEYSISPLPSSGGNRKYSRISWNGGSCIAATGTNRQENATFLYLGRHFSDLGLPVPKVLAVSEDGMTYLQEDLGDRTLFDAVSEGKKSGRYSPEEKALLKAAVETLPDFQYTGASGLDFSRCRPVSAFDRTSAMFDLNYFKYCFLKPSGVEFDETALEEDFNRLCNRLLLNRSETFQYRDFQGRNIMVTRDGKLYFIDFQGGRMGPVHYDLASFVWQAKARYSPELKEELTDAYIGALSRHVKVDRQGFLTEFRHFVLFRTLQVLGAYGFRGLFERRPHFLESIPYAMDNIAELLAVPFDGYPYLNDILMKLIPVYRRQENGDRDGKLHIRISSFSYRKGIPEDNSGNGGGYVFDCRGVPNPGRLPEYRGLTGLDAPVAAYLRGFDETAEFAGHTASLADMHIDNYLERGFTDLMFSFGCTGGRHRSVYFAETLAEHLKAKYGASGRIRITLCHREQNTERQVL